MCIIAIKPKNVKIQSEEILRNCFTRNSDGAGYMFVLNEEVIIKKGLMKFTDFYNSLMEDYKKYDLEKQNVVMHFRIGTSGESATGCTHPFPVTNDLPKLELLHVRTNLGVCHNGIISDFNDRKAKYSDTELYIAHVITPLIKLNISAYKFKDVQELIYRTTVSKWAFLNKSDEVYIVGDFIKDGEYLYSNSTYESYKAITTPYYTDYYRDDYEDDEWYYAHKNKQAKEEIKSMDKGSKDDLLVFDFIEDDNKIYIIDKDNKANTIYNKLIVNNVVCFEPLSKNDKTSGYIELETNDTDRFYFNSDWNLLERIGNDFRIIGKDAVAYTDTTFKTRIDFED